SSKRPRKNISQADSPVITETADVTQPRRSTRAGNAINLTSKTNKTGKTQSPKYPAPNIRTDSSSDDEQLLPTKHKRAKKTLEPEPEPEQDDENESNTSEYEDELDAEGEIEGEREDDAQASNYIQAELILLLAPDLVVQLNHSYPLCPVNQERTSKHSRRQLVIKHRNYDLSFLKFVPIHFLLPTPLLPPPLISSLNQLDTALAAPAWLECTNIHIIKKVRTFTLAKTGQPPVMLQIIDKSIAYGKLQMIFNHEYSPLHTFKIKQLAHACLMEMAERSGHDGNNNVCDRLERGDHDSYSIPLVTYVSRRIGNERADLKAHSSTILQAFGLVNHAGCLEAGALARRRTYYYPEMFNGMPDYRKPFEHPVFASFLREAFSSSTYYSSIVRRNFHLFKSSNSKKSEELEVTKGMVALAAAAIHACLHDYSTGMKSSFPAPELDGVWGLAIDILEGIESRNHSNGNSMTAQDGWCNQQHLDAVDWDAIENSDDDDDSNGDDESRVYPNPVGDSEDVVSVHSGNSHHTEASTTPALATISTPSD
ncbi:MAG: hypothetical protein NXY57DRAFT_1107022, partial [Lentinula lateritia]